MHVTTLSIHAARPVCSRCALGENICTCSLYVSIDYLVHRPPLVANIRRCVLGEELQDWVPQSEFLGLIGTGCGSAVGSKGGVGVEGEFLWTLKESIDRTWMAGYSDLPSMEEMEQRASSNNSSSGQVSQAAEARRITDVMGSESIELLSKAKMR